MALNICGLYFLDSRKEFLPLVDIEAHTTILATISRTKLTQTYLNPSENKSIQELKYTFPLYDGVSVVGFTYRIGDQTIAGQVKEREKARNVFKDAVARGEKAALLEQLLDASDVFTATVGNVPPGTTIVVEITYIGECKHDAEVDGIRFTIPTTVMPRYGEYPVGLVKSNNIESASGGRIKITIDMIMAQDSVIQQIQSPSHPIAVSLGTTSLTPDANLIMSKAFATLSLGSVELNKDFIVQVVAKDAGIPTAILETHPTIPNHRALMVTLVPSFVLPPENPEIVFMCDRSGSMDGSNITLARSAMRVFLKSLPVGVMFNICSFGNTFSFLWDKSQTYTQATLEEALKHVDTIDADMGGTEMYEAIEETFDRRCKDIPLEVLLLTDGEIWEQQRLFSYLNKQVIEGQAPIRVFTLGIGNGVSHALIEGVAKAGNGFSQSVGEGERMENKVVRMLEGALSPHVVDYTLEVKYADECRKVDMGDNDVEVMDRVTDGLNIKLGLVDNTETEFEEGQVQEQKPTSLIDTSVDPDSEVGKSNNRPVGTPPNLLQAPSIIPPLYAFNRTNVYLLMGPECSQMTPTSVVLCGTSRHGPLEIEIPIQVLDTPGEIIHQLAAKKAIVELEQGRGWITQAMDEDGVLIKSKYWSLLPHLVEREAVRLGVQFQIQGKWSSFVAAESQQEGEKEKVVRAAEEATVATQAGEETVAVEQDIKADAADAKEGEVKEVVFSKKSSSTSQRVVPKEASWFRRVITSTEAAARGVASTAADAAGAVVSGNESVVHGVGHAVGAVALGAGAVATGDGVAAAGALRKIDGVWKHTVPVLTTRKAHVDELCPIYKHSYVYYEFFADERVYDSEIIDKYTGVKHVTQLLYHSDENVYYIYYRWSETEQTLSEPYQSLAEAKYAYWVTFKEKFDVDWTERETAVSKHWSYETKTYEAFEEVELVEVVVDEIEATMIIARQHETLQDDTIVYKGTMTTAMEETVAAAHIIRSETFVEDKEKEDEVKGAVFVEESGSVSEPVVSDGTSKVHLVITGTEVAARGVGSAAAGAVISGTESAAQGIGHVACGVALEAGVVATGLAAPGAPHKIDGVWKRTVQVLATRNVQVDELCPIRMTSFVYYDEDVYDSEIIDKNTGVKHVTQLLYNSDKKVYYVYYRWSETEYTLSEPYQTIEEAKNAFQLNYKKKFDVDWTERETAVSGKNFETRWDQKYDSHE